MALTKVGMQLLSGVVDKITTTVKTLFNVNGSAPLYACRAWGYIPTTLNIEKSANVQSVVKNATGAFTVTLATPMPSYPYSVVVSVMAHDDFNHGRACNAVIINETTFKVFTRLEQGGSTIVATDYPFSFSVFG